MKLLLDTHAFLWFLLNDDRLSNDAQSLIATPENDLLLSSASCWEIAIKISLGKYSLGESLETFLTREIVENRLTMLPITVKHVSVVAELPFHHRDPFDRLLIAQAISEQIPILSADAVFDLYQVARIW